VKSEVLQLVAGGWHGRLAMEAWEEGGDLDPFTLVGTEEGMAMTEEEERQWEEWEESERAWRRAVRRGFRENGPRLDLKGEVGMAREEVLGSSELLDAVFFMFDPVEKMRCIGVCKGWRVILERDEEVEMMRRLTTPVNWDGFPPPFQERERKREAEIKTRFFDLCWSWEARLYDRDKKIDYVVAMLCAILSHDDCGEATHWPLKLLFPGENDSTEKKPTERMQELWEFLVEFENKDHKDRGEMGDDEDEDDFMERYYELNASEDPHTWLRRMLLQPDEGWLFKAAKGTFYVTAWDDPEDCELGWSALHEAIVLGDEEGLETIADCVRDQLESPAEKYVTPLHLASRKGRVQCVTELLRLGVAFDPSESWDITPLHRACQGGHVECVRLLLQAGARVNCRTTCNRTPLHYAVESRSADCVRELVGAKADVEAVAEDDAHPLPRGWRPLHHACAMGYGMVVRELVEAGADMYAIIRGNWTPLIAYSAYGNSEVLQELIAGGIDLGAQSARALSCAIRFDRPHRMRELLQAGADNEARWGDGTVLHTAAEEGRPRCVAELLTSGAQVDSQDQWGRTPLVCAALGAQGPNKRGWLYSEQNWENWDQNRRGCLESIRLLKAAGADTEGIALAQRC